MAIHGVQDWQACGCGEEHIPGLLARVGLLGTTGLLLAMLVIMLLAGWLLATAVWLIRRRRPSVTAEDSPPGSLSGFTWTADEHLTDDRPR
ncbi:hypothetical protein HLK59_14990 [Streptomyces sp. S3(2020)]|uniref:hypothetical protein n=1 Tax=Streptomyces sp. S3(2020) TaxID=2732044 RepID=UPI001488D02B|nr:hypothetical protein [Streptomyces sp. S3(2020)]NNN31648.1 hypothetical protein [Streptomyces sp. S3(2020)]